MSETAGTLVALHVEDHVVVLPGGNPHGNVIQVERMPRLPRDYMVCASGISADAEPTNDLALSVVERQAAAEDDRASDSFADERIVRLTVILRLPCKDGVRIGRRRHVDPEQALPWLRSGVEVRRGEREIWRAEGVRSVRLLGGDEPASRPLR